MVCVLPVTTGTPFGVVERKPLAYAWDMAEVSLSDLLQLTVAERIQLAQDLWDGVATETLEVPLSDTQRQEVLRRSAAHRQNPDDAVPLDEALDRIERPLT